MSRDLLRFAEAVGLGLLLIGTFASAAEPDQPTIHKFKFTVNSRLDTEIDGKKQKRDAETVVHYTWKESGKERLLSFDSAHIKSSTDGKETMNIFMSRARFKRTIDDQTTEFSLETAPKGVKRLLEDSFEVPVCKLLVDENRKEIKREMVGGPGAKPLIENGVIANALTFHPPFMRSEDQWSTSNEMIMGNGTVVKGELNYKKVGSKKAQQKVKVSGTLTNPGYKLSGTSLSVKKAQYHFDGEQTYDPTQREWVTGKLVIALSFEMTEDDKVVGSSKGTLVVNFEKLPDKK
jgi:hypothetical protein